MYMLFQRFHDPLPSRIGLAVAGLRPVPRRRRRPGGDRPAAAADVGALRPVGVPDGAAAGAARPGHAGRLGAVGHRRRPDRRPARHLGAGALLCLACAAQAMPSLAAVLVGTDRVRHRLRRGVDERHGVAGRPRRGARRVRPGPGGHVLLGGDHARPRGRRRAGPAHRPRRAVRGDRRRRRADRRCRSPLGTTSVRRATPAPPVEPADLPLEIAYFQPPVSDGPGRAGPRPRACCWPWPGARGWPRRPAPWSSRAR